jgi:serine phosphatase RsbU (regulator of sigma subunit)
MNSPLILTTLNLALGGLVFLLGVIILRENPGQRLNRVVAFMLFFGGFGSILAATAFLGTRPATSGVGLLESVAYVWEFYFPTLFLFANIFPEERPWIRQPPWKAIPFWTPGFGAVVFAPHVFHFALMLILTVWTPQIDTPTTGMLRYAGPILAVVDLVLRLFLVVHQGLFSLVNVGFGIASMVLLANSYRRAEVPRLKGQLRVIALGLSASLVLYSLATSIPTLFNFVVPDGIRSALTVAALTLGPGSIAYSIVRYKFLDAKLLARRAILYALTSAALVGVYLLVVNQLNRVVTDVTGLSADVFEPVFLIIALVLFQPAVARLEEVLDHLFMKDPGDYRNVVRQLVRELQTTIDLEVLLSRTIRTLAEALLTRRAYILAFTRDGAMVRRAGGEAPLEDERRLAEVLARVGGESLSYRPADRVDGLEPEAVAFLRTRMGLSLLVPLRWREDLVGMIALGPKVLGTNYTSEDEALLTTLAAQASVSLQNALLLRDRVQVARLEEELSLARDIQQKSLLSHFPPMPRCEVHALYVPSRHVGGDFYDVVEADDGSYLVAIADVSGKGMPAALLSAMLQASLRTQAGTVRRLSDILCNINSLLYQRTESHRFATFFLARVDCRSLELTFSNAGHNWPVVARASGERILLERGGTILGILDRVEFQEGRVALSPGDVVVLYTDGMSEAANATGEQFGDERLYDLVQSLPRSLSAREVAERLLAEVRTFLDGVDPQDDITVLVLRVLEPARVGAVAVESPVVVEAG